MFQATYVEIKRTLMSVSVSVNMDKSLGAGSVDMENASVDQGKFFEIVSTNIVNNNSESDLVENSEYLITEKLHKMVKDLIKHQVKHELNLLSIKSNNVNEFNPNDTNDFHKSKGCTKLIDSLNSEIDFLRKEVASKDKIIELLIKDKGIIRDRGNVDENKVNNNNPFKVPKIYAKNNYDEYINVIPVNNSYNALAVENVNTGEKESTEPTSKPKTKYRSTTIIGDSIIRDIKQQRIRKD